MSNSNTATQTTRVTSRSISIAIFLAELPKRGIYSGHKAFDANTEKGLYISYTQFRQTVRDMIIEACGCTAASARTMFIWCKDNVIEQVKAGDMEVTLPNGKTFVITADNLSLVRDIKPKQTAGTATVERAVETATDTAQEEAPKADKGRWLVMEGDKEVGDFPSKAKAQKAKTGNQKVVDSTKVEA